MYSYDPPMINSIVPPNGTTAGGTIVTVREGTERKRENSGGCMPAGAFDVRALTDVDHARVSL